MKRKDWCCLCGQEKCQCPPVGKEGLRTLVPACVTCGMAMGWDHARWCAKSRLRGLTDLVQWDDCVMLPESSPLEIPRAVSPEPSDQEFSRCWMCRWYDPKHVGANPSGFCRRYAPVAGGPPEVRPTDWCGEFEPAGQEAQEGRKP
jgi:hypothetical protein